jgi:branched-chain amino acid transport system permease protein
MAFIATILGMSFSMIYSTGLITLGAAALYGIGAYASTLLSMKLGLSFWVTLPLAVIVTGIIALVFGLIVIKAGTFVFVLLTMLFGLVVVQVAGSVRFFGGWGGITNVPRPSPIFIPFHGPIEFVKRAPYYYLALFLLLLIVLIFYALYRSRIGRAWKAIKQSSRLAQSMGINIYRYRVLAFVIASCASGAIGSFYVHYYQVVLPDMASGLVSIYIQVYAALGGLQFYILGPAIGAAIMIFGFEFLRIAEEMQPIIFGALLIGIIVFFPGGILGTLQAAREMPAPYIKLRDRVRSWLARKDKQTGR